MPDRESIIGAIADAARNWRDPEYLARAHAVEETLQAENTFTEEALAFAVNQQMSLLVDEKALQKWAPQRGVAAGLDVGVLNAGNVPLVGLQDFLAVILSGHRYVGSVSSRCPVLLPSFAASVSERVSGLAVEFVDAERLFERADVVLATGSDETAAWVAETCDAHGIPPNRRIIRGHRFSVAVIDGGESTDDLERLAEDTLLHEGVGCRNVALIWAPTDVPPDDLLDSFARFRAVFPPHSGTSGRLKMQQAFLQAVNAPHAYGENLEFLLSKGDPEIQPPGHVRWAEYDNFDDVRRWLSQQRNAIQLIVARGELHGRLGLELPIITPGNAQRPPLDWRPDDRDLITFLADLT